MDWDHLRSFEAVARLGSLTGASRALAVSQSTISRHLRSLEQQAGSPLLLRETPIQLTQRGEALLEVVRHMVDHALAAQSVLEEAPEPAGEVIVTTVGELLRWTLVHRLPGLYHELPGIRLRLLADNLMHSLAAGEADLALRLARPEDPSLIGRHLQTITYGYFISTTLAPTTETPWLGLTGTLAAIPEQRYAERAFSGRSPRLLVEDVESLGLAVQAGLGVAILPQGLARRLHGLVEIPGAKVGAADAGPMPIRELWMVVHRCRQSLPKVQAVMQWLEHGIKEGAPATIRA